LSNSNESIKGMVLSSFLDQLEPVPLIKVKSGSGHHAAGSVCVFGFTKATPWDESHGKSFYVYSISIHFQA